MKNIKRGLSCLILLLVYVLSFVAGWIISGCINLKICSSLLVADVAATVIVFVFSVFFGNASVYDPYWSVQPLVFVTGAAVAHGVNLLGVLILIAIWFWGLRLTANWAYTFHGLGHQDWRYTMLKEKSGWFYPVVNFFGIHMIPTLVVYCCMRPAIRMIEDGCAFRPLSLIGIVISLGAATMQGIADIQMHSFKKNGGTGFIRVGLWKYGRHPNYLGEIMMWWGVALTWLLSSPDLSNWPLMISGAVFNTCLFLFISIPLAEKHQARKSGFAEYKKETRLFI
ncbi:MAG: DUF1295 domain-containing protein [Treponema sp.]|nr:DUF1295 domain-containing protein [Candidatus Treponema caballi]